MKILLAMNAGAIYDNVHIDFLRGAMNKNLDLNDQNKVTVMLVQALWGAISLNFRMIFRRKES